MSKKIDMIGKTFNNWLVLSEGKSAGYYKCQCSCGTIKEVKGYNLRSNASKSCGCLVSSLVHNARFNDLTNQRFGRLLVTSLATQKDSTYYWNCQYECGNTTVVSAGNLRKGNTRSCGCLHQEATSIVGKSNLGNYKDLTNLVFDKLTVVSLAYRTYFDSYWNCKCDCGNEVIKSKAFLYYGRNKSCGCSRGHSYNFKDITNQRFGMLTALSFDKRVGGHSFWVCKCDCGTIKSIDYSHLVYGHTYSCGCNNIAVNGSKGELEIKDFIGVDSVVKDRDILEGKEIDLFYSDYNIGIEYNGSVYHASLNGVYKDLPKLYHRDKFLMAKKKGIHLISIFDVDWENNQDKIKMYLKSLFTKNKKLFARKCELKFIDRKIANAFTDKYHIQGRARQNTTNYGLYYEGELYAVMSFGGYRLKKNEPNKYELHRYCVKDGYTVIGGAEKLLKAFEREYNPVEILSFSDNDYFLGGIYERLGFTDCGQSTPRYYWYLDGVELKREQCQLKHLKTMFPDLLDEAYKENVSNKEDYVMTQLGASKVYHSGNTRWVKYYGN